MFQFDSGASLPVMLLILFSISALLTDVVIELTAVRFVLVLYMCVCVAVVFSVQAVLLNVFEPVSNLFSECSGEHCVLCECC